MPEPRSLNKSTVAGANTSRQIELATRADCLDSLTRPLEPGSLDVSTWPQQLRCLDGWTGPSEPRSLDGSTWLPEPSRLDGLTWLPELRSKQVDFTARID